MERTVCRPKKSSNWPVVEYIFILLWNTGALKMYNGSEWSHCTQWKDILAQMVRMWCKDWRVRCTNRSVKLTLEFCSPNLSLNYRWFLPWNLFRTPHQESLNLGNLFGIWEWYLLEISSHCFYKILIQFDSKASFDGLLIYKTLYVAVLS